MKKLLLLTGLCLILLNTQAQSSKFYTSNTVKFINDNNDTLDHPFTGGLVAPQFSEIDLNSDGQMDLFVFDRSGNKVLTFLNKSTQQGIGHYVHAPQYEGAFPRLYRWVLLRDYNNDGKMDIFTEVDVNSPRVTTSGIRMFKNVTGPDKILRFEQVRSQLFDIGIPPDWFPVNVYVPSTDIPSIVDIDNDGDLDILSFGVLGGFLELYKNLREEKGVPNDSIIFQYTDPCWGSFVEGTTSNTAILGQKCFRFNTGNKTRHAGATINHIDMDNDGDYDMLLGNISFDDIVLAFNGKSDFSYIRDSLISVQHIFPLNTTKAEVPTFPASYFLDVTNDGAKDLIVAPNDTKLGQNVNQILLYENTGTTALPVFDFATNDFLQSQTLDLGSRAVPTFFDYDQDGIKDLIVATYGNYTVTGNTQDRLVLYRNITDSINPVFELVDTNYLNIASRNLSGIAPTFGDVNNDGKPDLVLGDFSGKLHYLENTTTSGPQTFNYVTDNYLGIDVGSFSTPQIIDLDRDGLNDLLIGGQRGNLNYYHNDGNSFTLETDSFGNIQINDFGFNYIYDSAFNIVDSTIVFYNTGYSAPHVTDIDGDGLYELLVGANSGRVHLFSNIESNLLGTFTEADSLFYDPIAKEFLNGDVGERAFPTAAYLDGDTLIDIMVGNLRGGLHFYAQKDNGSPVTSTGRKVTKPYELKLFPNPANQEVRLLRSEATQDVNVRVVDLTGRQVWSSTFTKGKANMSIPLDQLNNGIYIVQLSTSQALLRSDKLIVVH